MEMRIALSLVLTFAISTCKAFYVPKDYGNSMTIHIPESLNDLRFLLCRRESPSAPCDDKPKQIVLNKIFDFTKEMSFNTEDACDHTFDKVCETGTEKLILKKTGMCDEKPIKKTQYSVAGLEGLDVGSNRLIVGYNGGGMRGKGLRLMKVANVEIRNLIITDINPHLVDGGSAIEMRDATNVLVQGNLFKNIGHHMIVTKLGSSTGVTIANNQFDGHTKHSDHCDGTHMYVWSFMGDSEMIRLKHNTVFNAGGRTPYVAAQKDTKTIVHLYQNMFYHLKNQAAIQVQDRMSSVLVEGNVYNKVDKLVDKETVGNVYLILTNTEEEVCEAYLSRDCLSNTMLLVNHAPDKASRQVLTDFKDAVSSGASSLY